MQEKERDRLSYTMSSAKKKYILNTASAKLGCSSGCISTTISALFSRRPRPRRRRPHPHCSSSISRDTTAFSSFETDSGEIKSLRAVQGFGRIGGQSLAVEKDSDDPYLDFRRSMLQMILEKEIYSRDDLKEMLHLHCLLQLNSPYYHGIIIRAFMEIWNGVCSPNLHGIWDL